MHTWYCKWIRNWSNWIWFIVNHAHNSKHRKREKKNYWLSSFRCPCLLTTLCNIIFQRRNGTFPFRNIIRFKFSRFWQNVEMLAKYESCLAAPGHSDLVPWPIDPNCNSDSPHITTNNPLKWATTCERTFVLLKTTVWSKSEH